MHTLPTSRRYGYVSRRWLLVQDLKVFAHLCILPCCEVREAEGGGVARCSVLAACGEGGRGRIGCVVGYVGPAGGILGFAAGYFYYAEVVHGCYRCCAVIRRDACLVECVVLEAEARKVLGKCGGGAAAAGVG